MYFFNKNYFLFLLPPPRPKPQSSFPESSKRPLQAPRNLAAPWEPCELLGTPRAPMEPCDRLGTLEARESSCGLLERRGILPFPSNAEKI